VERAADTWVNVGNLHKHHTHDRFFRGTARDVQGFYVGTPAARAAAQRQRLMPCPTRFFLIEQFREMGPRLVIADGSHDQLLGGTVGLE
jgi:hypothetical protein